jgi:hypothetical protein
VLSPRQVVGQSASVWGFADEGTWSALGEQDLFSDDFPEFDLFSGMM